MTLRADTRYIIVPVQDLYWQSCCLWLSFQFGMALQQCMPVSHWMNEAAEVSPSSTSESRKEHPRTVCLAELLFPTEQSERLPEKCDDKDTVSTNRKSPSLVASRVLDGRPSGPSLAHSSWRPQSLTWSCSNMLCAFFLQQMTVLTCKLTGAQQGSAL